MSTKPPPPRSARLQAARRNGPKLGGYLEQLPPTDPTLATYLTEPALLAQRANVVKSLRRAQGLSLNDAQMSVDAEVFAQEKGSPRDRIIAALKAIESRLGKERRGPKMGALVGRDEEGEAVEVDIAAPEREEQFEFNPTQILRMYQLAFGALP